MSTPSIPKISACAYRFNFFVPELEGEDYSLNKYSYLLNQESDELMQLFNRKKWSVSRAIIDDMLDTMLEAGHDFFD